MTKSTLIVRSALVVALSMTAALRVGAQQAAMLVVDTATSAALEKHVAAHPKAKVVAAASQSSGKVAVRLPRARTHTSATPDSAAARAQQFVGAPVVVARKKPRVTR
jgi:hypothetical protein